MGQITNENEFEAWFEFQNQKTYASIATRAALRAFPFILTEIPHNNGRYIGKNFALLVARIILTSVVASKVPNAAIKTAARSTHKMAISLTKSVARSANRNAISASYSASYSAGSVACDVNSTALSRNHAYHSISYSAYSPENDTARYAVYPDAHVIIEHDHTYLLNSPLWITPQFEDAYKDAWEAFKTEILPNYPDFNSGTTGTKVS